jgi:photosystem II S4 domain protein
VEGNFLFDPATHRDFLGSILGTGIERQVVGDILVQGDRGAQILVSSAMVEHLESSLTQVRSVRVKTRVIPLTDLRVPVAKVVEIQSTESSLRLDAIASAGFRISRSKMSDLIKGGDVRLNWKSGAKTSIDVQQGDVISVGGKGRVEVKNVTLTKKGKYYVEMVRYV